MSDETTGKREATVLLVDDELPILLLYSRICKGMTQHGKAVNVETASDGKTAWERIQRGDIGLLVADDIMPGYTGTELVNMVRGANYAFPIIMISGTMQKEKIPPGVNYFYSKPLNILDLKKTIQSLLDSRDYQK